MMLVKLKMIIAVIWLMFLSLVHSLAMPFIRNEMISHLRSCPFPPDGAKGREHLMSMCFLQEPDPRDAADVKFTFAKYLCMELFDVSLQLCDPKFANKISKIEDLNTYNPLPKPDEFCSKLIFSESRALKTRQWADVAINNLKIPAKCKKSCFSDEDLNPLCGAIFLGNQLLIALSSVQQQIAESPIKAVESVAASDPVQRNEFPIDENEIKRPSLDTITIKEIQKSDIEGMNYPKSITESNTNDDKELADEIKSQDLITENNKDTTRNNQLPAQQNANQASSIDQPIEDGNVLLPDKSSNVNLSSLSSSVLLVSSAVSPIGTEAISKEIASAPTDDREDSDMFKSKGKVDVAGNGGFFSDGDGGEVEPKGTNADDFISPSVPQEENYAEQGEILQNLPKSIDGDRSYNKKVYLDRIVDAQDSHFFAYFLTMVVICIVGYLVFHNKQKIIALALEGRRMHGSRRRPNTSSYKKLDSNLEEAVTSTCSSSSVTHVIF